MACSSQSAVRDGQGGEAGAGSDDSGTSGGKTLSHSGGRTIAGGTGNGGTGNSGPGNGGLVEGGGGRNVGGRASGGAVSNIGGQATGGSDSPDSGGTTGSGGYTGPPGPSNAALDASTTYQTVDGVGVSINPHSWDKGAVIPALEDLDNMGTRIWRVSYDMTDWETTNDNSDPNSFNWTTYNQLFSSASFEELWSTISWLNEHGHDSGIILDFMGRVPDWMGGAELLDQYEDEFVEMVVAAAYYGQKTRNLKFGLFTPTNETDYDGIEGPFIGSTSYAYVCNEIVTRLDALGLSDLKLVGPDTARGSTALAYFLPAMLEYPKLMDRLAAFSLHEYYPTSENLVPTLKASPYPKLHGWITETGGDGVSWENAWQFFKEDVSAVVLWEGYDSVYRHAELAGRGSEPPNDGWGPAPIAFDKVTYSRRDVFYRWKHFAKYMAPGMQRIRAASDLDGVEMLAFKDSKGGLLTVIGRNDAQESRDLKLLLSGLAPNPVIGYASDPTVQYAPLDVITDRDVANVTVPGQSLFTLTTGKPE